LESQRKVITGAFLFGSAARGDMTPSSDIDLALLCPAEHANSVMERSEAIANSVRERYGNRLNVLLETRPPDRLRKGRQSRDRLWRAIFDEGIPVLPLTENPGNG
jgi:predicted nucleotidyltransferase